MVLQYYGKNVTIDTLKSKAKVDYFDIKVGTIKASKFGYTRPSHLSSALNEYVPFTRKTKASEQDIADAIKANKPVIVLVNTPAGQPNDISFHYFVIVGYETDGAGKVTQWKIMDTHGDGPRMVSRSNFYEAWDFKFTDYYTGDTRFPFRDCKCVACNGKGDVWTKCPTCSGTGKWSTSAWTKCTACSGTGKWSLGIGSTKCPVCSGTGKWSTSAWTKCVACSGTGEWRSKCPTCLGTGNICENAFWKIVNAGGAEPRTMFIPNSAAPSNVPLPTSPSYSLVGTWKSGDNTLAISSDGRFTLYVANTGQKTYYYSYNKATGGVIAKDAAGKETKISVQWINQNSFRWTSPNGTRTYQKKN